MTDFKNLPWDSEKSATLVFVLMCLAFVVVRYYLLQTASQVLVWFDSATYADIARHAIFSRDFWFGYSPPAYPYFMKFFWLKPWEAAPMACCQNPLPGLEAVAFKPLPLMPMELAQYVTTQYRISSIMLSVCFNGCVVPGSGWPARPLSWYWAARPRWCCGTEMS